MGDVAENRDLGEEVIDPLFRALVERGHPALVEVLADAAGARADRHLVVVEDDQHILVEADDVIERLEDNARYKRPVADDGHRVAVFLAGQVVARFQAGHGRDAGAGMAGHEQVEGALVRVWVAHQPALGADRGELLETARDELVRIDLMPRVPNQAVAGKVVGEMEGQAEFHHAQVAREMSGPDAENANQFVADLLRQLAELRLG